MMFKNRQKSIFRQVIDLTPLLDVIFILLIVVLGYQDNYKEQFDKAAEEHEISLQEEQNKYDSVNRQLETYENIDEYVNVVTVYAAINPSNRKHRTLRVIVGPKVEWEKEINPSNEKEVWDECRNRIESALSGKTENPTIFSVIKDDEKEKMLYRDEQSIKKLYDDLNKDLDNLYYRFDAETADE